MQILCAVLAILTAVVSIGALIFALRESSKMRKAEQEQKAEENKVNETITEANKTKADARTGDHDSDFNFMADVLHDYAKK